MKISAIQKITGSGHEAPSRPPERAEAMQRLTGVRTAESKPRAKAVRRLMPGSITSLTALRAQSATIIKAGRDEVIFSANVGGARLQFCATRIGSEQLRIVSLRAAHLSAGTQASDKAETKRKPSRSSPEAGEHLAADTDGPVRPHAQLLAQYRLTQDDR